ncbi:hypothetical protein [Stenotrophomonas sp.]|uniref:hypothetical protein n=1 Tax=Stenotrophomonas sp. TaxID=69392 RepID=UPI0028AA76A5|nr:hypothetical protein [Stenotrophomonas sp.]
MTERIISSNSAMKMIKICRALHAALGGLGLFTELAKREVWTVPKSRFKQMVPHEPLEDIAHRGFVYQHTQANRRILVNVEHSEKFVSSEDLDFRS